VDTMYMAKASQGRI